VLVLLGKEKVVVLLALTPMFLKEMAAAVVVLTLLVLLELASPLVLAVQENHLQYLVLASLALAVAVVVEPLVLLADQVVVVQAGLTLMVPMPQ